MEGSGHDVSLTDEDRVVSVAGEDFDAWAGALDAGCADENHLDGSELGIGRGDEAVELAAVGVASDGDVEGGKRGLWRIRDLLCQQDGAGAGTESRLGADELAQAVEKAAFFQEIQESRGLAAGDDEGVQRFELLGLADVADLGAELAQAAAVSFIVALD